jgi:hypothetical protein
VYSSQAVRRYVLTVDTLHMRDKCSDGGQRVILVVECTYPFHVDSVVQIPYDVLLAEDPEEV